VRLLLFIDLFCGVYCGAALVFTFAQCSFVALLLEKKLLDLPKLLDICAIYEYDNSNLTSSLVGPSISFFWLVLHAFFPLKHILNVNLDVSADEELAYVYPGYKCYQCATKCFG
jgi:hypothetical protein